MSYDYTIDGNILEMTDVHLSYGDSVILKNVSGRIDNIVRPGMAQGQVVAMLGPSGVGKSKLLRLLSALDNPGATVTGSITVGSNKLPVRPGLVGFVMQNYPLFNDLTVLKNLTVAGKRVGLTEQGAKEKAMQLLAEFNLADRHMQWPSQLSGGQQQRVAVLQQLMCSEHIVLLDEPFSGQDPIMVDTTIGAIQRITTMDEYNTVLFSTHEITAALSVADTVWVLGRDRNPDGTVIPGAYIKHRIDLIAEGLTWRPDIRKMPRFRELASELRDMFKEL